MTPGQRRLFRRIDRLLRAGRADAAEAELVGWLRWKLVCALGELNDALGVMETYRKLRTDARPVAAGSADGK